MVNIITAFISIVYLMLLSGCASSLSAYGKLTLEEDEAIVLISNNTDMKLTEARYCDLVCTGRYSLSGARDIVALPIKIGDKFKFNIISGNKGSFTTTTYNVRTLRVKKPGIYFYSSIENFEDGIGYSYEPNDSTLVRALLKYGDRLREFEPNNFKWPSQEVVDYVRDNFQTSYKISDNVQSKLRTFSSSRMKIIDIKGPEEFDLRCGKFFISTPDYVPIQEYLKLALNKELKSAGIETSKNEVTGELNEISFSTKAFWKIRLTLRNKDGITVSESIEHKFLPPWNSNETCIKLENKLDVVIKQLFEKIVNSEDFPKLLKSSIPNS